MISRIGSTAINPEIEEDYTIREYDNQDLKELSSAVEQSSGNLEQQISIALKILEIYEKMENTEEEIFKLSKLGGRSNIEKALSKIRPISNYKNKFIFYMDILHNCLINSSDSEEKKTIAEMVLNEMDINITSDRNIFDWGKLYPSNYMDKIMLEIYKLELNFEIIDKRGYVLNPNTNFDFVDFNNDLEIDFFMKVIEQIEELEDGLFYYLISFVQDISKKSKEEKKKEIFSRISEKLESKMKPGQFNINNIIELHSLLANEFEKIGEAKKAKNLTEKMFDLLKEDIKYNPHEKIKRILKHTENIKVIEELFNIAKTNIEEIYSYQHQPISEKFANLGFFEKARTLTENVLKKYLDEHSEYSIVEKNDHSFAGLIHNIFTLKKELPQKELFETIKIRLDNIKDVEKKTKL